MAKGLSNAEVTAAMGVAEAAVKMHVTRVLSNLGCGNRVQPVVFACASGLVQPGERPEALWPGLSDTVAAQLTR